MGGAARRRRLTEGHYLIPAWLWLSQRCYSPEALLPALACLYDPRLSTKIRITAARSRLCTPVVVGKQGVDGDRQRRGSPVDPAKHPRDVRGVARVGTRWNQRTQVRSDSHHRSTNKRRYRLGVADAQSCKRLRVRVGKRDYTQQYTVQRQVQAAWYATSRWLSTSAHGLTWLDSESRSVVQSFA